MPKWVAQPLTWESDRRGGEKNTANDENLALAAQVPELERLHLYKGKFTKTGLAKLWALPKLKSLSVSRNRRDWPRRTGCRVECLRDHLLRVDLERAQAASPRPIKVPISNYLQKPRCRRHSMKSGPRRSWAKVARKNPG